MNVPVINAPARPEELTEALARHLHEVLPRELSEVLMLAVSFRVSAGRMMVITPNPAWRDVFRDHAADIARAWLKNYNLSVQVVAMMDAPMATPQHTQRFAEFLHDPGNQLALTACRRVVEAPGLEHNPLYLHGPAGCGKSHLLAAVAAEFRESLDDSAVVELDGPTFVARDAQLLAEGGPSTLRTRLERAAVICFDRVESLTGRAMAQESLFSLINEALERGTQLIFSGHAAPKKLEGFADRVSSRLAWGLSAAIETPQIETRLALLTRVMGIQVADMVPDELARLVETYAPDMHQVLRLAERIAAGEKLDRRTEMASFDHIVQVVADRYGIRASDIAGQRRVRDIARARQVALYLGRRLTGHSLTALGGMVGGRDHSTVLHAIRTATERVAEETEFAREMDDITQKILAGESSH